MLNSYDFEKELELCLKKLNKEIDLDWGEIVEELGTNIHKDNQRKFAYAYKKYNDYLKSKGLKNLTNDELVKLDEKILEYKAERVKKNDMAAFCNKKIRELARVENFIDNLKENINILSEEKPFINSNQRLHITSGNDAVLMLSDIHYGLTVNNYINKYNVDICKSRLNVLIDKVLNHCRIYDVDKLHLFCLGDLISGEIHNILRIQNQISLSSQLVDVAELISELIYTLAQHIPFVTVHMCNGNHSRTQKRDEELDKDNYLFVIREFIKLRVQDLHNVVMVDNKYDEEIICTNIKGYTFVGTHGHYISKDKVSYQLSNILHVKPDVILLGHFHEPASSMQYETQIFVNGSVVASDTYSKKLKLHTFPMQKMLLVNETDGVFADYTIKLNKI